MSWLSKLGTGFTDMLGGKSPLEVLKGLNPAQKKKLLRGVTAMIAITAAAEGGTSEEEIISGCETAMAVDEIAAAGITLEELVVASEEFSKKFKQSPIIGRMTANAALRELSGEPESLKIMVAAIGVAVGESDGNFGDKEKEAVRGGCKELKVSPALVGL